jgi:hypothetical protein
VKMSRSPADTKASFTRSRACSRGRDVSEFCTRTHATRSPVGPRAWLARSTWGHHATTGVGARVRPCCAAADASSTGGVRMLDQFSPSEDVGTSACRRRRLMT